MMSISMTLFGKISHASLFITSQLRNPWQMLAEPWGSAEPRLKNTGLMHRLVIPASCKKSSSGYYTFRHPI